MNQYVVEKSVMKERIFILKVYSLRGSIHLKDSLN